MQQQFITFEGIEGCGKSTQAQLLHDFLKNKNIKSYLTREPGGTLIADKIRQLLLDKNNDEMEQWTELFLYCAARAEHVKKIILPKLAENSWVLCDRYTDSTLAYQGYARNMDLQSIEAIHQSAGFIVPNKTILFDCPAEVGLERARVRREAKNESVDRLESEAIPFHQKVRNGFLDLAKKYPKRFIVLDATKNIETLHTEVISQLNLKS